MKELQMMIDFKHVILDMVETKVSGDKSFGWSHIVFHNPIPVTSPRTPA